MNSLSPTTSVVKLPLSVLEACRKAQEISTWLAVASLVSNSSEFSYSDMEPLSCIRRSKINQHLTSLETLGLVSRTKQANRIVYTLPLFHDSEMISVPISVLERCQRAGHISVWVACCLLAETSPNPNLSAIGRLAKVYKLDVVRKYIAALQDAGLLEPNSYRPITPSVPVVVQLSIQEQIEQVIARPADHASWPTLAIDATGLKLWERVAKRLSGPTDEPPYGELAQLAVNHNANGFGWFYVAQALLAAEIWLERQKKPITMRLLLSYMEGVLRRIAARHYLAEMRPEVEIRVRPASTRTVKAVPVVAVAPEAEAARQPVRTAAPVEPEPAQPIVASEQERCDATPRIVREALAEVCGVDLDVGSKEAIINVNRTAKRLYEAACKRNGTPEETVEAIRYVAKWFAKNDWRGKKGDLPTPKNLTDVWGAAIAERAERKAPIAPKVNRSNTIPPLELEKMKMILADLRRNRQGESRQGEN